MSHLGIQQCTWESQHFFNFSYSMKQYNFSNLICLKNVRTLKLRKGCFKKKQNKRRKKEDYWPDSNGLICLILAAMAGVILDLPLESEEEGSSVSMGANVSPSSSIPSNKPWVEASILPAVPSCSPSAEVKGSSKIMQSQHLPGSMFWRVPRNSVYSYLNFNYFLSLGEQTKPTLQIKNRTTTKPKTIPICFSAWSSTKKKDLNTQYSVYNICSCH